MPISSSCSETEVLKLMHLWKRLGEVAVWDGSGQDAKESFKPLCPIKEAPTVKKIISTLMQIMYLGKLGIFMFLHSLIRKGLDVFNIADILLCVLYSHPSMPGLLEPFDMFKAYFSVPKIQTSFCH